MHGIWARIELIKSIDSIGLDNEIIYVQRTHIVARPRRKVTGNQRIAGVRSHSLIAFMLNRCLNPAHSMLFGCKFIPRVIEIGMNAPPSKRVWIIWLRTKADFLSLCFLNFNQKSIRSGWHYRQQWNYMGMDQKCADGGHWTQWVTLPTVMRIGTSTIFQVLQILKSPWNYWIFMKFD